MSLDLANIYLTQFRCKNCGKVWPFRYQIYDGHIQCRCKKCKAVTALVFLKGNCSVATVVSRFNHVTKEGVVGLG